MIKNNHIGIIGGSGVYQMESLKIIKEHEILTPFGSPSSKVIEGTIHGANCFFIPRHGIHHSITPSEVNYRANIFALKKLGVRYIVSVSAVGSLKEECPPRSFVIPDQFIDWTKGKRERSFFGQGIVGHVSCANPVDLNLSEMIYKFCKKSSIKVQKGGSYICIEGPQFSTRAESNIYRSFGASVIGMTNVPEAFLAKEAGIAYATLAMVTDFDCWKEEHCTLEEIMNVMKDNNMMVKKVLEQLIPHLDKNKFEVVSENANSVVTHSEEIRGEHDLILKTILS